MTRRLLLAALLSVTGPGIGWAQDVRVEARRGDVLVAENFSGSIAVVAWGGAGVEVRGIGADRGDVTLRRNGQRVVLAPSVRRGRRGREADVEVRIPAWMGVEIGGRELEIRLEGIQGGVRVRNVEGDIEGVDLAGGVSLSTVDGEIRVRGVSGRTELRSRGDDVWVRGARGDLDVESGDGDLVLEDVRVTRLRAETLDGDVRFSGAFQRGGTYAFSVHDGDALLAVPRGTGARFTVATFDGEFASDFAVVLERFRGGRAFEFTLGDGGAEVQVQVFDGEIRLMEAR